jgi:hypothetical protein|tara:strand:+ start:575 stop:1168 length:594 start_codon:yes stop_codon:yes gene_type:complete
MARKKIVVQREKVKPLKKKRKLSEEHKEKLRARLAEMRAKKKPAEYKNIAKSVLALPDDDKYSMKNVKEWIKESKDQVAAFNKTARSMKISPQDKQKAQNAADAKKAYIRYCEHYLKTGDWIGMFSGKEETNMVVPKCTAMAYYPDGTPKRTVGVWYPDIEMVWTKGMDERDYAHIREGVVSDPLSALTDKQFTSST